MADLGFPPRRGRQLPGGAPTYDFAKFSQNLHEFERIWTGGGARPKFYYVDPPLGSVAMARRISVHSFIDKNWKLQNILEVSYEIHFETKHQISQTFAQTLGLTKKLRQWHSFIKGGQRCQNCIPVKFLFYFYTLEN